MRHMDNVLVGGYALILLVGFIIAAVLAIAWTLVPFILMGMRKDIRALSAKMDQLHYLLMKHDKREAKRASENATTDGVGRGDSIAVIDDIPPSRS